MFPNRAPVRGLIGDIWDAKVRGKAMVMFAVAPYAGPSLGPVVAGWIFWVLTIFAGVCLAVVAFTMPETYIPVLLATKAHKLRQSTKDDRYYAPMEANTLPLGQRVESTLSKPFKLLFLEPMMMATALYMSFMFGTIYLLFEAYPIVFTQDHHLDAGVSGLAFLPISIGAACGAIVYLIVFEPRYERYITEYAPNLVPPEKRLEMAMWGAPLFSVGFFWSGWTSYPSISFWSPLVAGGLIGMSIFLISLPLFSYIIDTYLSVAASALATFVRSLFGAAFPLFATQMYEKLNPR
ncbi:MFS general substrate transporter [Stereum hirsutum FP-91666 SS1]|uniref:MFS general substrate transporter n=1 Tax=Stereum hirsutum (strain FP-91666) TaxID=721885 RepID=R7RWI7_STEHR|nr:MFS general substrate transporter [Stereum hirsutum FP-91666 SS1]EIM79674.1 MFS general substrate transporter [Stereum hirsutum FP-91666 SS1]